MSETLGNNTSPNAEGTPQLTKPDNTDKLQACIKLLSERTCLDFTERLVLAAGIKLVIEGAVTFNYVVELACTFYGTPYPIDDAHNDVNTLTFNATNAAWEQLNKLVNNEWLQDTEATDQRNAEDLPQWANDLLYTMRRTSVWAHLSDREIISQLPREVVEELKYTIARENYGSLHLVGYQLINGTRSGYSTALGYFGHGAWFLDSVAVALRHFINVYDEMMEPGSKEHEIELGRITAWVMLLKAGVYALAEQGWESNNITELVEHPEIFANIREALTDGIDRIKQATKDDQQPGVPTWRNISSRLAREIRQTPTPELLGKVTDLIDESKDRLGGGVPL